MTKAIDERALVLEILLEITKEHVPSHVVLYNTLAKYQYLEKRERAFITRVTEGTLEHMIELDYIINQFSKVKVNKMKPVIRNIIRSAVYQMKYMDSVPNSAVCNEAVKLAQKKGFGTLKGFVNGVLRNIARNLAHVAYPDQKNTIEYLSVVYSMPEWILEEWIEKLGEECTKQMLEEFQREKKVTIRCNLAKTTKEELMKKLRSEQVEVEEHPYLDYALIIGGFDYLGDLDAFLDGEFYVQDISSMMVAEIAAPKEGDYIIDVCAAPGGKALHLAEKLQGSGRVEARDLTENKVFFIEENIERTNLSNITARQQDATVYDEKSRETADILIADLPCSGLGVIGKKPDIKYNMTKEQQEELSRLQKTILNTVHSYVKPGGYLVYSTCTIRESENMGNVRWFLEHFPEFESVSIDRYLPEIIRKDTKENCMQFLPGVHKSDGFFIAKFRKKDLAES